jgi:hypothetical protein
MSQIDGSEKKSSDTSSHIADISKVDDPLKSRWFDIIELLRPTDLGPGDIQRLLSEAMAATVRDSDWSSSGIIELLKRANDSAIRGYTDSAKKAALNLLDFHKVVLKYRQCPSPSGMNLYLFW